MKLKIDFYAGLRIKVEKSFWLLYNIIIRTAD